MAFLEQARLLDPFLGLRTNPSRYALASFLVEMLDRLSPEGIHGPEAEHLFAYAIESLGMLETARPTATLRLLLELRAFDALGLRPELGRCVRCGRVPSETVALDHRVNFHVPDGGIVFISTRRGGFCRCGGRPVPTYTLHRIERDGSQRWRAASPLVTAWRRRRLGNH